MHVPDAADSRIDIGIMDNKRQIVLMFISTATERLTADTI